MYFAEPTAFWINERSRVCWAERNGPPERADLVWVFTQDPLTPEVRTWLDAQLRRAGPRRRGLNPPAGHHPQHYPNPFPRPVEAGVSGARPEARARHVGATPAGV